ncbi:NF038122 family metalloprotease [Sphingomonas sp. RS6]
MSITMFKRAAAMGAAAIAIACAAAPAHAQLKINLIDNGGVIGSQSEVGFRIAAAYWESVITTNVTVNLGVGYSALGDGIIGSTGSTRYSVAIEDVKDALAFGGNSALDAGLYTPTITGSTVVAGFGSIGTIDMVRNGPLGGVGQLSTAKVFDSNDTRDNATVSGTAANLKALGYNVAPTTDANITFSSAFNFDFDPTDGISSGYMDFIGVAIHEMGHALGFTSGVDTYDYYLTPNGPGRASSFNWDNQTVGNILDLFRYSAPGTLDWSVGTASYFSIDGGATVFGGDAYMSTGRYNGDGRQASHFKDTASAAGGCDGYNQVGVMDPTFCYGEMGVITAADLAAFDAIGWNINIDVLQNMGYTINTAQIFRDVTGVPEPMTWGTMLLGFGAAGAMMRRRRDRAAGALQAA